MRNGTVWVALAALVVVSTYGQGANKAQPGTLIRWHFAGLNHLKQLPRQKPLQQVLGLAETAGLREVANAGFSQRAAARFTKGGSSNDLQQTATRIGRLLPDLVDYETKFQMVNSGGADADWILAIKLPEPRADAWRKELTDLARTAGLNVHEAGPNWTASHEKYRLALSREKAWTVLRGGYSEPEQAAKLFSGFNRSLDEGMGKESLSAEFNLPELGKLWKAERLSHAPRVVVNSTPNGDGFRSEVELEYSRDFGIKPEKWEVPTSLIREPLVGFTAIQGVRETLQASPRLKGLGVKTAPNQLFTWSVGDGPFSAYFAANVGRPEVVVSNLLEHIVTRMQKSPSLTLGKPQVTTNRSGFVLRGLPVVVPFAEAGTGQASEFVLAGLFPVAAPATENPPTALFDQLKKKDLIYYEWEITESRLKQWRPIWQLLHILNPNEIVRSDTPSEKWLAAITPKVGNTITEATLDGKRSIRVIRQSHMGFNALELVLLAHRLDPNDLREKGKGATDPVRAPASPPPLNGGKASGNSSRQNAETRR